MGGSPVDLAKALLLILTSPEQVLVGRGAHVERFKGAQVLSLRGKLMLEVRVLGHLGESNWLEGCLVTSTSDGLVSVKFLPVEHLPLARANVAFKACTMLNTP